MQILTNTYVNQVIDIHTSLFKQNVTDALCCRLIKEVMHVRQCSLQIRTGHGHVTNGITILYRRDSHLLHIFRMMNHGGEEWSIHHIMLFPKYPLWTLFRYASTCNGVQLPGLTWHAGLGQGPLDC